MPLANNHNIYEVRSSGAQEVLNKPPRRLIMWGNTLIALILVVSVWLLTLIQLPLMTDTDISIYVPDAAAQNIPVAINKRIILITNLPPSYRGNIPLPTTAKLYLDSYPSLQYGYVAVAVDSAGVSADGSNTLLYVKATDARRQLANQSQPALRNSMTGRAEIRIGTVSIFHQFLQKLKATL